MRTSRGSGGFRRATAVAVAAVVGGSLAVAPVGPTPAALGQEAGPEQVVNGDFSAGADPWFSTPAPGAVADGTFCVDVAGGLANPWDAIVGQNDIELVAGETYRLSFRASSTPAANVRAVVGLAVAPFDAYLAESPVVGEAMGAYEFTFTQPASTPDGQVAFQLGGASAARRVCLDDVSLRGGAEPEPYVPDTGPRVRVNQVGYLPDGPKGATLVTEATGPVPWRLETARGQVAARGRTRPAGLDPTSGLDVHTVDLTDAARPGRGYTLVADGERSHPFDVASDAYERLRVDALSVYYPQRSGTPIDGAVAGDAYARPAGHVGVPPNQGDLGVPCQPPEVSLPIYGEPWTCDYTLDVVGGWYDAGDHGKYVVNGGISVHQLMSTWERNRSARGADRGALGDSTLRVPERGNRVPDVLDEARWELEWMLTMQVPAGEPLAGMVHHKVHDDAWTGLPLDPAADPRRRELHRPSTAATLNLAAVAAQGARVFERYDPAFADRLLDAARVAWSAASSNPPLYAPVADGNSGGGPYDDADVTDERYWAAAELYVTTGERAFRDAVLASPAHRSDAFDPDGFDWGHVAALGRLTLATQADRLPDRERVRRSVVSAADDLLSLQRAQPWGQPYAPADGAWAWGSTSQILNNLVVLGTAHDLTGSGRYRDAVVRGMDFLLGRNALNISYVTGYGDVYSQNQHSRMYANQLDASLPHPPDGFIAGGPNSGIQDPVAQALLGDCPATPQFCYIDDIESWSTNEITINWNSALSWVASFVADQDDG
jgi:endoglucanase